MTTPRQGGDTIAWIGLGSNIGDGSLQIRQSLEELQRASSGTTVLRVSSFYRSRPLGMTRQASFTNAVCEVRTSEQPLAFLRILQDVESRLGRERNGRRWGPRCIDMDLLLWGEMIYFLPGLTVPHPRMHKRAFVLIPLSELEPGLEIPAKGSVRSCLERLPDQGVSSLA